MKYKDAGVNIDAGEEAVKRIKKLAKTTSRPEVLSGIGGFGGFFRLAAERYQHPVLVSGTDSVGTKIKIATSLGRFDTLGIDVVAMCVNDILTSGAEPLFFLDYLAVDKIDPDWVEEIVAGVAQGCRQSGCALLGGETAELPGVYPKDGYDLVGFAVGVVEQDKIIDGSKIKPTDKIIGLPSRGLHSNGFSLARAVFDLNSKDAPARLKNSVPELGKTLGEELLEPTRIYVKTILPLLEKFTLQGLVHITGGGLIDNLPRVLPEGCGAFINKSSWPLLPIFSLIAKQGKINEAEMFRVFNMGIGMAVIVSESDAELVTEELTKQGETFYLIGEIRAGEKKVTLI